MNTTDTPTPRTDAAKKKYVSHDCWVQIDFARTLERELIRAEAELAVARDALSYRVSVAELVASNAALRAALRGIVFAADDVLCDPEGRCVFQGTDADRHHVQVYLDAARAALAGGKEAGT